MKFKRFHRRKPGEPVTIRKYVKTRIMFDTETSLQITLEGIISRYIMEDIPFRVMHQTKGDITHETLLACLRHIQKRRKHPVFNTEAMILMIKQAKLAKVEER